MTASPVIVDGLRPEGGPPRRVAVAMSGGVDSSLAAVLLADAGYDVVGLTMRLWEETTRTSGDRPCCDPASVIRARDVAVGAGFPHHVIDLHDAFNREVVDDFVRTYLDGRTPNPCVVCNARLKWAALRDTARGLGCDLVATGHYARIALHGDGTRSLVRGVDANKDQSYFLWRLTSDDLAATILPLGGMTKDDTRMLAAARGLASAATAESQEICFIPDNDYGRFLRDRCDGALPASLAPGDILDTRGAVIGRHRGAAYYTIGQRRGLGIALGHPAYVVAVDARDNTVTVGGDDQLMAPGMAVTDVVWTRGFAPAERFGCAVRIRSRHDGADAEVTLTPGGAIVDFTTPQRAVTPGQSAVFYDGDVVLGGAIIDHAPSASGDASRR